MSDITQGQDAVPQDGDLFREALDAPTLEKFENPPPLPEKPTPQPEPKPQPEKPDAPDAPVPSGRFREESEARRRAEREASELRARLAAFEVQPRQPQQPEKKLDVFDNPSAFVQQEVKPYLDQMQQQFTMMREAMSADNAGRIYGHETVAAARAALEQGMARHDPHAWATYNRAMASHDPYGVITRAHMDRETLTKIGGDLNSYNQKYESELLKNPEFLKRALEAAKGQAAGQVNRPAVIQSQVPTLPSLSDIGAAGADEQQIEPDDNALFRAAVSAKRR